MKKIIVALVTTQLFSFAPRALADYALVLRNGRRIVVQGYREDSGMIKFHGLGGEIGIARDQILAIEKVAGQEPAGLVVPATDKAPSVVSTEPTLKPKISPQPVREKEPSAEQKLAEERAKQEKEYDTRLKTITEQIKQLSDEYSRAARGNSGPEPYLFTTEEAFRRHQEDLLSRLRAAQNNPGLAQDLGPVNLVTSSSPDGRPEVTQFRAQEPTGPTGITVAEPYTEQQKALTDLREKISQLQKARQRLIEEMKQKNFATGSLFLE